MKYKSCEIAIERTPNWYVATSIVNDQLIKFKSDSKLGASEGIKAAIKKELEN
jgi:hypothetical protein